MACHTKKDRVVCNLLEFICQSHLFQFRLVPPSSQKSRNQSSYRYYLFHTNANRLTDGSSVFLPPSIPSIQSVSEICSVSTLPNLCHTINIKKSNNLWIFCVYTKSTHHASPDASSFTLFIFCKDHNVSLPLWLYQPMDCHSKICVFSDRVFL